MPTLLQKSILLEFNISMCAFAHFDLQVKLSGRAEAPDIIWASKGIMAMATGEAILRYARYKCCETNFYSNNRSHIV